MARTILLVGLLFVITPFLSAETPDVAAWFRATPTASAYLDAQPDVEQVFNDAAKAGLPQDSLMDRLREGTAKGVPADVLVGALRAESGRLQEGQDILQREGVVFPTQGDRDFTLRLISFSLIAGLAPQTVESVFVAARTAGRGPAEARAAVETLVQAELQRPFPDGEIQRLGSALMKSRMRPAAFNSVLGFLDRANRLGLSEGEAIDRVIAGIQDSSGGAIRLEDGPQATVPRDASRGHEPSPPGGGKPVSPGSQGQDRRLAR